MRHPVPLQHLAVDVAEQLRVPQLDRVAGPRGELLEEAIELVGPLEWIGEILAAHRLKLEHERSGVIAERALVGTKDGVLEDVRVQEVGIALPGERAPPPLEIESLRRDPVPHFADAGKSGRQRPRVGRQRLLGGGS